MHGIIASRHAPGLLHDAAAPARTRAPAQTLQEDREAVILADRLGFYDAFVGEHLTEKAENITNSFIFLATLISDRARSSSRPAPPTCRNRTRC